ncbi:hypothetical protein EYB45_08430 [Erythrobacteraceae bacterium CFH 75059]|uniref:hypothetical protein n=1 Tax=Qipengyuania thermophila TaxID=2509361 RepID=UPI0010208CA6|nr:hypothetical protein [Qipengyuania thermophila]TCD04265.1 hypothetical protein EYB45_08430 [Erythrobacteraceae bacterium CFH 75059]
MTKRKKHKGRVPAIARKKHKGRVPAIALEKPTPEQLARGGYVEETIINAETNTRAIVMRNRESTILQRWINAGEFDEPSLRVIADCLRLWEMIPSPQVTSRYAERLSVSRSHDGLRAHQARADLAHMASMVPAQYWRVYEDVVRFNAPAGLAAAGIDTSRSASNSARLVVRFVASVIAMRLGY